ncbi:cell wall hydrolase SleB [Sulfobacillus acidophilus DSM 10332]|uniref:Cell wall hydrolase SleB n=1 Tax=Sulfobacillus acidophilus (strain ATCC 700253 / DSM 10332 / NAL) TaxID=679936 RepID=G8U084_SULAD|nr:cell wall hydrolase SleB [Sulfobacillus acidophilus DSM 10332]
MIERWTDFKRDRMSRWSEAVMTATGAFIMTLILPGFPAAPAGQSVPTRRIEPPTVSQPDRREWVLLAQGRVRKVVPRPAAPTGQVYRIQWGDTLWTLAERFHVTVNDLEEANHLTSPEIYAGQSLIIPETYQVTAGDTLASVAKKFGVPLVLLWHTNRLVSDKLKPGQTLVIPYTGSLPETYAAPTLSTPDPLGNLPNRGAPVTTAQFTANDLLMLAHLVQGEAGDQPFLGQVAVAAVVLNRLKTPGFPKTLAAVIWDPGQFESVSDGAYWQSPGPLAFMAAKAAMAGWDPTGGALYFYNPSLPHAAWMDTLPQTAVIGSQVFCR